MSKILHLVPHWFLLTDPWSRHNIPQGSFLQNLHGFCVFSAYVFLLQSEKTYQIALQEPFASLRWSLQWTVALSSTESIRKPLDHTPYSKAADTKCPYDGQGVHESPASSHSTCVAKKSLLVVSWGGFPCPFLLISFHINPLVHAFSVVCLCLRKSYSYCKPRSFQFHISPQTWMEQLAFNKPCSQSSFVMW